MDALIRNLQDRQSLAKVIGQSPAFLKATAKLPTIAKSDAAVLITGETGTGKELAARALHYASNRASCPFIALNCGSMPETLLEDELFGHEKGAFTDARNRRRGLIAEAEPGTLFLDEVDSLPPKAQVALLRVLQEKRFRMVGSSVEQAVDIRIVTATNTSLKQLVESGKFRADLYYRLSVFFICLPPLRERKEDILLLAEHFLQKHAPRERAGLTLTPGASSALISFEWPGNVRELENAIVRGIHLSEGLLIDAEHLGLQTKGDLDNERGAVSSFSAGKKKAVETFERDYLIRLMTEHHGNVSSAAKSAQKERRELGKLLRKNHLEPGSFRRGLNLDS